jgi:hypothetical protein
MKASATLQPARRQAAALDVADLQAILAMAEETVRRRAAAALDVAAPTTLMVARTGIVFADIGPGCVGIEITVRNTGDSPSPPTAAVLTAAPLGAFVPWRPLAVVPAPALMPGESAVLRVEARRPAVAPLGPPDRVPPRRLLTALGAEDDRPRMATPLPRGVLPADLMDLLGRKNAHWAGNLNVFIGGRDVERHLAQALRVYPGRVNLAMFVVGGRRDAYRFHVTGAGADWKARLYDMTGGETLNLDVGRSRPVEEGRWVEAPARRLMFLALEPPAGCGVGSVAVHVTQRSSGREAVVEFSLDPAAAGPGCYTV